MTDGDAARARIDQFYRQLERKNHFELLGVPHDVAPDALRNQFLKLARDWHADAFVGAELGDHKRKLDEIFQQINEAYETLKDEGKRSEYMILLDRKKKGLATDVHSVLRAEGLVDDALAAMRRRAWGDAKDLLQEAQQLNADDPLYLVYLGWATYQSNRKDPNTRDAAIRHLRSALERQDNLALAYQYLGQIHFDRDGYEDAIKWWKRCLRYDRNNIEATRGLRLANTRLEKANKGLGGLISKLFGSR
jgi:curved DNA-binding protein CbpA